MKKENMNTFKRFLVICLTLGALVSTANIVAFAGEISDDEINTPTANEEMLVDNNTVVIYNNDGSIDYQTLEDYHVYTVNKNDFLITETNDSQTNDSLISPYALSGTSKVLETMAEPYKYVCYIEATFPNGDIHGSSGTLIYKNIVLACAHGIYKPECGGHATKVVVYPAQYYNYKNILITPFGAPTKTSVRMPAGYINHQLEEYDWSLIDINKSYDSWQKCGYAPDYTKLKGRSVNIIGYQRPQKHNIMYEGFGIIDNSFEKILHISVKSEEGMSGGPVIDTKTGGLIGIIKGHKNITLNNVSVRMDEYLYNIIVNHRAEMQ